MARGSRYADCHLFHHLIIYSRSCRIACLAVLQPYVYCSRQQLYPTEELLDKEVENDALVGTKYRYGGGHFLLNSRPLLIVE